MVLSVSCCVRKFALKKDTYIWEILQKSTHSRLKLLPAFGYIFTIGVIHFIRNPIGVIHMTPIHVRHAVWLKQAVHPFQSVYCMPLYGNGRSERICFCSVLVLYWKSKASRGLSNECRDCDDRWGTALIWMQRSPIEDLIFIVWEWDWPMDIHSKHFYTWLCYIDLYSYSHSTIYRPTERAWMFYRLADITHNEPRMSARIITAKSSTSVDRAVEQIKTKLSNSTEIYDLTSGS